MSCYAKNLLTLLPWLVISCTNNYAEQGENSKKLSLPKTKSWITPQGEKKLEKLSIKTSDTSSEKVFKKALRSLLNFNKKGKQEDNKKKKLSLHADGKNREEIKQRERRKQQERNLPASFRVKGRDATDNFISGQFYDLFAQGVQDADGDSDELMHLLNDQEDNDGTEDSSAQILDDLWNDRLSSQEKQELLENSALSADDLTSVSSANGKDHPWSDHAKMVHEKYRKKKEQIEEQGNFITIAANILVAAFVAELAHVVVDELKDLGKDMAKEGFNKLVKKLDKLSKDNEENMKDSMKVAIKETKELLQDKNLDKDKREALEVVLKGMELVNEFYDKEEATQADIEELQAKMKVVQKEMEELKAKIDKQ